MTNSNKVAFSILAAGKGTRMKSPLPKVLSSVLGEPMIFGVLDSIRVAAPDAPVSVVVGFGREEVKKAIASEPRFSAMSIDFVLQEEQLGTGHAAKCALESQWGKRIKDESRSMVILPGDFPLLNSDVVAKLVAEIDGKVTLLTTERPDPTGYGRVIRQEGGARIVEQADASPEEQSVKEVAVSIYAFDPEFLGAALSELKTDNAQGEYYLPDVVFAATREKALKIVEWREYEDLSGVNDPWELALASEKLALRRVKYHAQNGVRFDDPKTVRLGSQVELSPGSRVGAGCELEGRTKVAEGARIEADCTIRNTEVGTDVHVKRGCYFEDSAVDARVKIGPYAHLRPGSRVGAGSKIGNFVELKKTELSENVAVSHLSYLGDAKVGKDVNIGCGFITCNFDGRVIDGKRKHETIIEDEAFVGSDCQTVAPVTVGKGAYVASGTTVTKNVPEDALAVGRVKQENKLGYASRLRGMGRSR
jgi:bifunctional UDP-N-acetylglucosamine pyrophosphorylase/glucosamine-1-phosphate N-acetyltransferase